MEPQLNQFIGCDKPFDDAKVVLFGAPYDSTTSFRPGTRFGPAAMRAESFGIETYSMLQDRDIAEDASVFDSGDLELPFGAPDAALDMIELRASEILGAGKIPFLLGGEHLVTLGSVRAVAKRYPNLHIVHFDAHAESSRMRVFSGVATTSSATGVSSSSAYVLERATRGSS